MKKKVMMGNQETTSVMLAVDCNNVNQNPYWPDLAVLPPIPYSNQEPRFNDHTSFRKLLINLGGKFSDNDHDLSTLNPDLISNPQYHSDGTISSLQPVPIVTKSSHDLDALNGNISQLPNNNYCNMDDQAEGSTFPGEFMEEMLYNIPQRHDGLEFLYGDTRFSSTNGELISMDWGEMNSLTYLPPIDSSCESTLQPTSNVQKVGFEAGLRYMGPEAQRRQ